MDDVEETLFVGPIKINSVSRTWSRRIRDARDRISFSFILHQFSGRWMEKGEVQSRSMNNFNEIFIAAVNSRFCRLLGARNRNLSRSLSVEKLLKETSATYLPGLFSKRFWNKRRLAGHSKLFEGTGEVIPRAIGNKNRPPDTRRSWTNYPFDRGISRKIERHSIFL